MLGLPDNSGATATGLSDTDSTDSSSDETTQRAPNSVEIFLR